MNYPLSENCINICTQTLCPSPPNILLHLRIHKIIVFTQYLQGIGSGCTSDTKICKCLSTVVVPPYLWFCTYWFNQILTFWFYSIYWKKKNLCISTSRPRALKPVLFKGGTIMTICSSNYAVALTKHHPVFWYIFEDILKQQSGIGNIIIIPRRVEGNTQKVILA